MIAPSAYCHRCQRDTTTVLLPLSSGHIGRCCSICRATRKGHPFASRQEFETFTANARKGRGYDHAIQKAV